MGRIAATQRERFGYLEPAMSTLCVAALGAWLCLLGLVFERSGVWATIAVLTIVDAAALMLVALLAWSAPEI